jgi:hypothetical protein
MCQRLSLLPKIGGIKQMTKQMIFCDKGKTQPVTDFEVDEDGRAIIRDGRWYVFGGSRVKGYEQAMIYAFDKVDVRACENTAVNAFENAVVEIGGLKMDKVEYRYNISEDRESVNDSGYDYRVVIEARQACNSGEWLYVDSFHTLSDYEGAVDDAENQIEWLASRKIWIAD